MSLYVNQDDVERQLLSVGIVLHEPIDIHKKYQRWKIEGSKGKETPGWSRLKEWVSKAGHRYIVGYYGVWRGNDDGYTRIELPGRDAPDLPVLSDEEIAAQKAAAKAAAQAVAEQRRAEQKRAAGWAAQVWACSIPAVEHEYLARKGIGAHGTRVWNGSTDLKLDGIDEANFWRLGKSVGALVVPMHDVAGAVCGLQFIFPNGHEFEGKQFWPTGMAMGGSFGVVGGWRRTGVLLLTEGFATAASLNEATTLPAVYAFSANNLGKTTKAIRAKYKQLRILVCADDDYLTEQKTGKNPGVDAAMLAASEIEHAAWMKPGFTGPDGADLRGGRKLSDFNDLAVLTGLPMVLADQVNVKLDELKWRDAPAGAGTQNQGGGEGGAMPSFMDIETAVRRYWGTYGLGGKVLFDETDRRLVHKDDVMNLLPPRSWDLLKTHPMWRVARDTEIGFDPTEKDKSIRCNLFGGWPTTPKAGRCDRLLELLRFLCSMEPQGGAIYDWIIRWLAYPLQHRGAKMHSAIVVQGPQGTGKSRFFEAYAKIFGPYGRVLGQEALEDKFNADWAEKKLFILADEVLARQDMYHVKNRLKGFITGDTIRVNPKNVAAHTEKNQMNIVFLSNERMPLVLENDDRRHCVIWTPPKPDEAFFNEVNDEIDAGGIEALHHYLLTLDLGDFKPWTKPPMTSAKQDLINLGKGSEERFVEDWINGDTPHPVCPCASVDLYKAYQRWCKLNGVNHPRELNQFIGYLGKLVGWAKLRERIFTNTHYGGDQTQAVCIHPPKILLEQHKTDNAEGRHKAQWLTDCVLTFRETLGGLP